MTPDAVYNAATFHLFPSGNVPTSTTTFLRGTGGLIGRVHKRLQQLYNFWFLETDTTWALVEDQIEYDLPDNFKEIISIYPSGDSGYEAPLRPLIRTHAEQYLLNQSPVSPPKWFEIVNDVLRVYPAPSEDGTLNGRYYKFFAYDDVSEDVVLINAGEIIVDLVVAELSDARKEFDDSKVYRDRALEKINLLRQEEHSRRESYMKQVGFGLW